MMEKLDWSTVQRKVNDLIAYEYNPRILSEEKKQVLINSINKYGFVEIPVIDIDNKLLAGHQRCVVMKMIGRGEEMIDVRIPNRKLTDQEFKEYNIQSNVSIGEWDLEMLKTAFADIDLMSLGLDVSTIMIPAGLVDDQPEEAVPVPEVSPKEPFVKSGDIFHLNDHVLMCGDSTNGADVLLLMDGQLSKLQVTDPPYNVNYEGENGLKIENDDMDDESFYLFIKSAYDNMYLIAESGAPIYVFFAEKEGINFRKGFKDSGFKLSQTLVWVKNHFVMGRHDYHFKHEPILYGWKEGAAHLWYGNRDKDSIIECDRPLVNDVHPTMKPVTLLNILIVNSSEVGSIVADLFGGSGSTMMSCEQLKRLARLMEFNPRYVEVIIRRYKNYMEQLGKPFNFTHVNGSLTLNEIVENV